MASYLRAQTSGLLVLAFSIRPWAQDFRGLEYRGLEFRGSGILGFMGRKGLGFRGLGVRV